MVDHLSIGDVLSLLRVEFPDVTISKIRFLESQGLIDPERTPSGYRKFYEPDIEQLRWVLRQQRDHYLPLKVIRARLDEIDDAETATADDRADQSPDETAARRTPEAVPLPLLDERNEDEVSPREMSASTAGASMTRADIARGAGIDEGVVVELESFGLLRPSVNGSEHPRFDEDALTVARAAAAFAKHGVEPRHLRMYRSFADREAALFEQVLLPLLRQRNPDAPVEARRGMAELAGLGRELRLALLRTSLRGSLT